MAFHGTFEADLSHCRTRIPGRNPQALRPHFTAKSTHAQSRRPHPPAPPLGDEARAPVNPKLLLRQIRYTAGKLSLEAHNGARKHTRSGHAGTDCNVHHSQTHPPHKQRHTQQAHADPPGHTGSAPPLDRRRAAGHLTLGNPLADTGLATDVPPPRTARGLLDPAADLEWTRRVYYALIGEALHGPGADQDPDAQNPDALATRIVDTLLHGAGRRG